ncbi:MAG: MotA/TolQ/ExbB proton channel family protein [Elusimicrobiales bacterium]|jgi:biopolymer transport protein ExbB/TolQ|nr:MotA/TolQ/ExbB proton channel family protein [Elusimicrobiales bacterium]
MTFSFKQLIIAGGPVLLVLTALSIYSIALIWERWTAYKRTFGGLGELMQKLRALLKAGDLQQIADLCAKSKHPAAEILYKAATASGSRAEKRELVEKALEWHTSRLNKSLAAIATVGSVAPFIGLFGTVIGVVRAFRDLSLYAGAGPSVVAMGIAEALVNTAAGLFVAVPAIVAYNFFTHRASLFASEINWLAEQVIEQADEQDLVRTR